MTKYKLLLAIILLITFIMLLPFPVISLATVDPLPLITPQTIVGVWEAIYIKDTIRVFRIVIRKDGTGFLAQGLRNDIGFLAELETMVIQDGKVGLVFNDVNHIPSKYMYKGISYTTTGRNKVVGTGRACKGFYHGHPCNGGIMDVELIVEPEIPDPKVWKLKFINEGDSTLTDEIQKMSRAAKEAIKKGHEGELGGRTMWILDLGGRC